MTMLSKAILIATQAHDGQLDKAGKPYILHPLTVMHKLKTQDEELQAIAVLHDVIEDTSVTADDLLNAGLSGRIVVAVECLTKREGQSLVEYKQAVFSNTDAMLVKAEDLRHNSDLRRLKAVTDKDIARSEKYLKFYCEIQQRLTK